MHDQQQGAGTCSRRWQVVVIATLAISLQAAVTCSAQQSVIEPAGQNPLSAAGQRIAHNVLQRAGERAGTLMWREFTLTLERKEAPDPAAILRKEATWLGKIQIKPGDLFPVATPDGTGLGIVAEVRENYVRTEHYFSSAALIQPEAGSHVFCEINEFGFEFQGGQVVFYRRQARFQSNSVLARDIPMVSDRPPQPERAKEKAAIGNHSKNGVPISRQPVDRLRETLWGLRDLKEALLSAGTEPNLLGRKPTEREKRLLSGAKFLLHLDELLEAVEEDTRATPDGKFVFLTSRTLEALGKIGLDIVADLGDSLPEEKLRAWVRAGLLPAADGFYDFSRALWNHIGTGKLYIDSETAEYYLDGIVASTEGVAAAVAPQQVRVAGLDGLNEFFKAALRIREGKAAPEVVTHVVDGVYSWAAAALGASMCGPNLACVLAVRGVLKETAVQSRALSKDWFRTTFAVLSGHRDAVLDQWVQIQRYRWKHGQTLERISSYGKEQLLQLGFTEELIAYLDQAADAGRDPDKMLEELRDVTRCKGDRNEYSNGDESVEEGRENNPCLPLPVGCPYESAACPFWWPRPPFLTEDDNPGNGNSPPLPATEEPSPSPGHGAQAAFLRSIAITLGLSLDEANRRITSTTTGAGTNPAWVRFALEKTNLTVDFIALQRYLAGRQDSPGVLVSQ